MPEFSSPETRKSSRVWESFVIDGTLGSPFSSSSWCCAMTGAGSCISLSRHSRRPRGLHIILVDLEPLLEEGGVFDQLGGARVALRGKDGLGAGGAVFFGDEAVFETDPVAFDVILPNGSWQLAAMPIGGWSNSWRGREFLLGGGSAIALYQRSLLLTHRDRVGDPPGRRGAAGDAGHRQGFPTPPAVRPRDRRRLPPCFQTGAFGRRCPRLAMPRIATPRAPCRKPWEAVSMSQ